MDGRAAMQHLVSKAHSVTGMCPITRRSRHAAPRERSSLGHGHTPYIKREKEL